MVASATTGSPRIWDSEVMSLNWGSVLVRFAPFCSVLVRWPVDFGFWILDLDWGSCVMADAETADAH